MKAFWEKEMKTGERITGWKKEGKEMSAERKQKRGKSRGCNENMS